MLKMSNNIAENKKFIMKLKVIKNGDFIIHLIQLME